MIKSNILFVGIGQAGNNMVNEILNKDSKYLGLFVNSSYSDMSSLENFKKENAFLLSTNQSGSGKNRSNAKLYMKEQMRPLVDRVTRYPLQDTVVVVTSADGGTGSGATPIFCGMLKQVCKDKKINLLAILPDCKNDDRISFENTVNFWNEINSLIERDTFDDIKLVDNSKGKSYKEINERVATSLNNAYSMHGKHEEGNIDDNDSFAFNTAKGFSFVLDLEPCDNVKTAVDYAIANSIFAIPDTYACDYLGISVNEDDFNIADVREVFEEVYQTTYRTYNKNNRNTVVLSGCNVPSEIVENIKMRLEEINEKSKERKVNRSYQVDTGTASKPKTNAHKEPVVDMTEEQIDDIVSGLDFLFD